MQFKLVFLVIVCAILAVVVQARLSRSTPLQRRCQVDSGRDPDGPFPPQPKRFRDVKIGTFNVASLSTDITASCNAIPKDLQVLTLQEVWLDSDVQTVNTILGPHYPYRYMVPPNSGPVAGCKNSSRTLLEQFEACLVQNNIQYIYYTTVIPCIDILKQWLAQDAVCAECYLALSVDGDPQAKSKCLDNQGYSYILGGTTAMMVLSKSPIVFPFFEEFPTFLQRQGILTFCVDGVLYGTGHWAFNWTYTTAAGVKGWVPLDQYYQTDMAVKVLTKRPTIFMGDLNTGPNYQPAGYYALTHEGYDDIAPGVVTFCPDPNAGNCIYEQEEDKGLAIDHILVDSEVSRYQLIWQGHNYGVQTFSNPPHQTSDHVGLRAKVSYVRVREHAYCRLPPGLVL